MYSRSYEINLPYNGGGTPEECLVLKEKLLKALKDQSTGPKSYTFTKRFLTDYMKVAFNKGALNISICTVDNFNKAIIELTKHIFSTCTFCKQKGCLHRHLLKPRSIKLHTSIIRLQELNDTLRNFHLTYQGKNCMQFLRIKLWISSIIPCCHGQEYTLG